MQTSSTIPLLSTASIVPLAALWLYLLLFQYLSNHTVISTHVLQHQQTVAPQSMQHRNTHDTTLTIRAYTLHTKQPTTSTNILKIPLHSYPTRQSSQSQHTLPHQYQHPNCTTDTTNTTTTIKPSHHHNSSSPIAPTHQNWGHRCTTHHLHLTSISSLSHHH